MTRQYSFHILFVLVKFWIISIDLFLYRSYKKYIPILTKSIVMVNDSSWNKGLDYFDF